MMADSATADQIHPARPNTSYSYWYLFNFKANFDAEYEPENSFTPMSSALASATGSRTS